MKYSNRHISDEELDQLFRDAQASEGPESLFVPEFWSEMEEMLPVEEKAKRGFYWIPLAATVVLGSIILFYPRNSAQISLLKQKDVAAKNECNQNPLTIENRSIQNASAQNSNVSVEEATQPKIKTQFQPSKRETETYSDERRDKHVVYTPQIARVEGNDIQKVPTDKVITPRESTNVGIAPKLNIESDNELDSIRLEARNEKIIHEEIVALPKKTSIELNQWYLELGPTLGQSPYLSPGQKRNVAGGAVLGGGYTKRIDNAFVSIGMQARMEGFGGLNYQETNFSPNIVRTVSVKQLYSLEVPLKFGYVFNRSEISLGVVPGVQLFIHGKEKITENQIVQREDSFTGRVEHSNSLTMEVGFQYYYNFSSKFSIGAKVNADILRPFHTDYYLGKSAGLPVNGQIVFRTTFSK